MHATSKEPTWMELLGPSAELINKILNDTARDEKTLERVARNVAYLEQHLEKLSAKEKPAIEIAIQNGKSLAS